MKIVRFNSSKGVVIRYSHTQTPFGQALVATTDVGVCYMGFGDNITELTTRFRGAIIEQHDVEPNFEVLHLMGTEFQLQVWQELLKIPVGQTISYKQLAQRVGRPTAYRAVGTAVGRNHISLLIPCHRVLASDGGIGGYYWGVELKKKILEFEMLRNSEIYIK